MAVDEAFVEPWIILNLRYGNGNVTSPTTEQLKEALADLYSEEKLVAIPEGIRDEHPSSWLRYGFDDGPEYCLAIYEGGYVIFTKNADQDDAEPLWEREMRNVSCEQALELWQLLVGGKMSQLETQKWE